MNRGDLCPASTSKAEASVLARKERPEFEQAGAANGVQPPLILSLTDRRKKDLCDLMWFIY